MSKQVDYEAVMEILACNRRFWQGHEYIIDSIVDDLTAELGPVDRPLDNDSQV